VQVFGEPERPSADARRVATFKSSSRPSRRIPIVSAKDGTIAAAESGDMTAAINAGSGLVTETTFDYVLPKKTDPKQVALAAIEGLEVADVLAFFYAKATPRDEAIASLVSTDDELNVDGAITSEGDDNGSWVLAWVWVDFADTEFDKEAEEVEDEE
jgi:hypothetical protein